MTKVAISWGRFQPPHRGHRKMIQKMMDITPEYWIGMSKSKDPSKNPLAFEQKIELISHIIPESIGHVLEDESIRTMFQFVTWVYDKYGADTELVLVAGQDRIRDLVDPLVKYNDVASRHGYYKFKSIIGEANTDLQEVRGTQIREAAKNNDALALSGLMGTDIDIATKVMLQLNS